MNLSDFHAVFEASYKDHPRSHDTSLRQWCRELRLRIPSSSIAKLTLGTLMKMELVLLKAHCHDASEQETLKYVLSRVMSELDKTLVQRLQIIRPCISDLSVLKPLAFQAPTDEEVLADAGIEYSTIPVSPDNSHSVPRLPEKPLHQRFDEAQQAFMANPSVKPFLAALRSWLEPHDMDIPYELLGMSSGDVLKLSFTNLKQRWVGENRLTTLMQLLERAVRSSVQSTTEQIALPGVPDPADLCEEREDDLPFALTDDSWNRWCQTVRNHDAGFITVAQAADSLRELHATAILRQPVQTFLGQSLPSLEKRFQHGSAEHVGIVSSVRNLAEALTHFRLTEGGSWRFLHANLWPIAQWLEMIWQTSQVPTPDELMTRLWRPIIWQLANDLPQRLAVVALMRLGKAHSAEHQH